MKISTLLTLFPLLMPASVLDGTVQYCIPIYHHPPTNFLALQISRFFETGLVCADVYVYGSENENVYITTIILRVSFTDDSHLINLNIVFTMKYKFAPGTNRHT